MHPLSATAGQGEGCTSAVGPTSPRRLARWPLAAALLLGSAAPATAAPVHVRLSYTGPTESSMTIAWNTTGNVGTEVRYGTSSGSLTQSQSGSSFQANATFGYVHEVTLAGLSPATTYYYQAGDAADGFSAEYSFTTGPAPDASCGEFDFVYLGDNRPDPIFNGGENYDAVLSQAVAHQPAFVVNGGDLVIDGGEIDQWHDYLGFNDPEVAQVPNMPCLGNHDTGPGQGDGANYNQLFTLPTSTGTYGSGTEDYYYFTYGNAVVAALSTETFDGGTVAFQNQASWLDEVLTANPRKWRIVFFHKPSYTHNVTFDISHEPNEEGQNAAFVPIFDKHHVDVVLTSHNHWYERYAPSNCTSMGTPGSSSPCPVTDPANGTVYYVSGGAGAFTIPGLLCNDVFNPPPSGRVECAGVHHYLLFRIANERLTIDAYGASPQANTIFDSLTITKAAEDCSPVLPDGGVGGTDAGAGLGGAGAGASGAGGAGVGNGGPGAAAASPSDESGCGCRAAPTAPANLAAWSLFAALGLVGRRRRRR